MSTQKFTFRHIKEDAKAIVMQNRGGQKVIERILKAYGFKSRQAFCNHLGISQSTMANRYARDTFPADWVVICSMETGASLEWLAFGSDAAEEILSTAPNGYNEDDQRDDVESDNHIPSFNFHNDHQVDFNQGGKAAIERIVKAYGFKTRQALADHLGISKSTLATRYMRDSFPADWIIQCALETGFSLKWLVDGQGLNKSSQNENIVCINKYVLADGALEMKGNYIFDKSFVPKSIKDPMLIFDGSRIYLAEGNFDEISDGLWFVEIEGKISVREVIRIPVGKVRVTSSNSNITFDCAINELKPVAKCQFNLMTII
ncbi:TPA: phage repressor protein CI [Escherichia coli]|uniref:phage repressor protein CI n=1 Tax=Escherichia coli TaxID=562 RepID=UPI000BE14CB2|nr:phage repressor protein CI [Escherichia coli]EEY5004321.1 Repressor protein CI [Escherichia coli]EEZ4413443.1 Repressor protein CI [Escherichia coli]EFO1530945.1 Repressor protein CI [Escherichia coli]EGJ1954760.1 Repressor protein CI [Escherichia coli]EGK4059135.1 Repressor protein CI [Escherichia coli]